MTDFVINILIVEDDQANAIELSELAHENGYSVSAIARSSSEAIRCIEKINPDLILLDLNIKGNLGGTDLALRIQCLEIPTLFLLKSEKKHDLTVVSEINHFGFIDRPMTKDSLKSSINDLLEKSGSVKEGKIQFSSENSLVYKKRTKLYRVDINDIMYVKAADDYTITVTPDQDFVSSVRLFDMEKKLSDFGFFKSHRSFLVNPRQLESLNAPKTHLLIKSHKVPISRNKKTEVAEIFKKILNERTSGI